ncbi:MAG: saccharopine dehydrogenase NADP-binding domain-containing protein [Gammaproteobacteria bacterium]|nr:saccharopine dehydrogenase NADP-binding domain-containing protein [Gammaproteobacteria bacterium]MDH5799443.1 saccharopine dehydrogenase NADP-binding domain-containing protein [Gammaproteobacteria bacterium]
MAKIIVLGAGRVGSAMALDLSQRHRVTAADISTTALSTLERNNLRTLPLDVTDPVALAGEAKNHDLVINAVPGFLGFQTLKQVLELGCHVVDISFFPEDPLPLAELAKKHAAIAVVDMGVAPGLSNIILGHYDQHLQIDRFRCLVGGLPKQRLWPFQYKAPFSPIDVIEEYTRPARLMVNGEILIKPALSDCELVSIENIGTLEAFNTDGLRSLLSTMPHIPQMEEKTLRYPGHANLINALIKGGFFDSTPLPGQAMSPLQFTSQILEKQWQLDAEEVEFTVLQVEMSGTSKTPTPVATQVSAFLYDEYDPQSGISSMARTTGYTCCATAELILQDYLTHPGLYAPEHIGAQPRCYEFLFKYLQERQVTVRFQRQVLE